MSPVLRFVAVAILVTPTLTVAITGGQPKKDQPKLEQPPAVAVDGQGDALPPGAIKRLGTLHLRCGGMLGSMVISPDGKMLATSSTLNAILLWDLASGRLIRRLEHPSVASVVFFTPDSKTIFTKTYTVGLHVWDVPSGKQVRVIEAGKLFLSTAALSPDGGTLAMHLAEFLRKREDGTALHRSWIELRDAKTNKLIRKFAEFEPHFPRTFLQFTLDGNTLLGLDTSNEKSSELIRWDPATGKERSRLVFGRFVVNHQFSRDLNYLAFYGSTGKTWTGLEIWDLDAGKPLPVKLPDGGQPSGFALAPDGKRVVFTKPGIAVSAGFTQQVVEETAYLYWDLAQGKALSKLEGQLLSSPGLFTADGKTLLASNIDGVIQRWDVATGKLIPGPLGHERSVRALAWTPDGKRLASCGVNETVRLWDTTSGNELHRVADLGGFQLQFASAGATLVVRRWEDWRLFDTKTARPFDLPSPLVERALLAWAVSIDGKRLAALSNTQYYYRPGVLADCQLHVWDLAANQKLGDWKIPFVAGMMLAFSPDGEQLAFAKLTPMDEKPAVDSPRFQSSFVLWNVAKGQVVNEMDAVPNPLTHLFFTRDGKSLVSGDYPGSVRLWDLATRKERLQFGDGKTQRGNFSMDVSSDGKLIATCDDGEGVFFLWDAATGKQLRQVRGHLGTVASVAFSPDGRYLASGSSDTSVLIWDVRRLLEGIGK